MASIVVRDLVVEYLSGDYVIRPLDGLDLDAEDGELVVLLGPSGAGKTTLLSCIAGILTPAAGSVTVAGVDVRALAGRALEAYRRETVGIVFQGFNLVPSLSARENVLVPLLLTGAGRRDAARRADELLATVDLTARAGHRPGRLSGGQQQRVAIARALSHDPPVLLADEPTAHLDHIQVEAVVTLLRTLAVPGRTVLVSTHDDRLIPFADRVVELSPPAADAAVPVGTLELAGGELVFEQGTRSDLVFVVETGTVQIFRLLADGSEEHVRMVGPEGYFGEMGPLLGLPRSASARATQPTRLRSYPIRDFRNLAGAGERARLRGD